MKTELAFAQGALFGDDERTLRTSDVVRSVLEAMPFGLPEHQFKVAVECLAWAKYPTFARLMTTLLANHGKMSDEQLAHQLAAIVGDLPSGETVARTRRALMLEPRFAGKVRLLETISYKKQKLKPKPRRRRKS